MADELARAPQALREEDAFLALAETLSALIALIQGDKLIYVNPAGARILGYPRDYYKGRNFWEFALPEDRDAIQARGRARQLGVEHPRRFIERLRHADGHVIWVDYSVDIIPINGQPTTLVTGQDITEQKKAEEVVRVSESLFRQLFTQAPVMICAVDKQDRLWRASDTWLKKLGYTQEEVIGTNGYQYLTPESVQRLGAVFQEKLKTGELLVKDIPLQTVRKDGTVFDILVTSVAKFDDRGQPDGWITVAQDLSEIHQAENALHQSEERFRAAFQNAAIGKAVTGADLKFVQVNRAFCDMLGYSEAEFSGKTPRDFTHPSDIEQSKQFVGKLLSGERESSRQIKRYVHKDGHFVWVDMTATLVRDAGGNPSYFVTEIQDISERKRAEELLKASEDRFRTAFQNAAIGKGITGPDFKLQKVNQAFCEMVGYSEAELLSISPIVLTHPEDRAETKELAMGILSGKQSSGRHIKRYVHKKGHEVWVDLTTTLIRDGEGKPDYFVTEIIDITERKRAETLLKDREAKLAESQRIAKLGRWEWDVDKDVVTWSEEMYKIFGITPQEFAGNYQAVFSRIQADDRARIAAQVANSVEDGKPHEQEYRAVWPNGEVRHVAATNQSVMDASGRVVRMFGVAQDITERKLAEEKLRDREAKLEEAQRVAHVGSWEYDIATNTSTWSDEMYRIFGTDRGRFNPSKENAFERFHPDDLPRVAKIVEEAFQDGRPFEYDSRVIHPNGEVRTLHTIGRAHVNAEGKPVRLYGIAQDVTERVQSEALLRDREGKLAAAQRIAHIGSWDWDVVKGQVVWSDELFRIMGLDPAKDAASFDGYVLRVHPDDRPSMIEQVNQGLRDGRPFESEHRICQDGGQVRVIWTSCRMETDGSGKVVRMYGTAQDVTERKQAEDALRTSEQRFRSLYTQAPVMMIAFGADGRIREVSNYWLKVMGYERQEVIGQEGFRFLAPESARRLNEAMERTVREGERVLRGFPLLGVRKDGGTIDILCTSVIEVDEWGKSLGAIAVGVDVTDIRRAEEAVRESEGRYRALVEHAPEAIVVHDVDAGMFWDVNEPAVRLFGRSKEELLKIGPVDCSPEFQPNGRPSAEMAQEMISRAFSGETVTFEWVHLGADRRQIPCLIRLSSMPTRNRNLIRATITDISDQKALDEKIRHAEKMAAIGLLAAGVAHEIGNPLLALSMAAQSLERKSCDEYAQKKLGLIREHIDRISKIVRQMSDLARPQSVQKSPCDVNRVLERTLEVVRYDKRAKEVPIKFEPCPDVPFVQAVEDQLTQVCLNLALNALDAMAANPPSRAKSLKIQARCVQKDGRKFVRASFIDSGPGIPEATRSKIFQPFYTTKATGKGTGLGLSVSYKIIQEHRGTLAFECGPKDETEFYFELPV